ncbi:hypothetical protein BDN72DRAFT_597120 [Pluteus cervinus]|uniref:Uncharacterized protein n=1 Tax=Pluteus cervinus TaxID=181527 RepID=A0ACD3A1J3_9AGAR|nr:hypothetical protein BDN72DRAFT_597120 [Pluteus cervinus]
MRRKLPTGVVQILHKRRKGRCMPVGDVTRHLRVSQPKVQNRRTGAMMVFTARHIRSQEDAVNASTSTILYATECFYICPGLTAHILVIPRPSTPTTCSHHCHAWVDRDGTCSLDGSRIPDGPKLPHNSTFGRSFRIKVNRWTRTTRNENLQTSLARLSEVEVVERQSFPSVAFWLDHRRSQVN